MSALLTKSKDLLGSGGSLLMKMGSSGASLVTPRSFRESMSAGGLKETGQHADDSKVMVTVPDGCSPGDELKVKLPDGKYVTLTIPSDARPGSTIEVERTIDVTVHVPKTAKVGDPLQVNVAGGGTWAFTVPPGTKPGSKIKVEVPMSQLKRGGGDVDDGNYDVEVDTRKAIVPADWDGFSGVTIDYDGRPLLFLPPPGARAGEAILLDVPAAGAKVRLTFTVPHGVYGGEIIGLQTPSGFLKMVTLPADAVAGRELTVRIADAPDADADNRAAFEAKGRMRAALQARTPSSGGLGMTTGKRKAQPIFVTLKAVEAVNVS